MRIEDVVFSTGISFFDERRFTRELDELREARRAIFGEDDGLLLKIEKFAHELQQWAYIHVVGCQRSSSRPMISNHRRPLEPKEFRSLLPYLDAIFHSMEGLDLQPPFREVEYYQQIVQQLRKKI